MYRVDWGAAVCLTSEGWRGVWLPLGVRLGLKDRRGQDVADAAVPVFCQVTFIRHGKPVCELTSEDVMAPLQSPSAPLAVQGSGNQGLLTAVLVQVDAVTVPLKVERPPELRPQTSGQSSPSRGARVVNRLLVLMAVAVVLAVVWPAVMAAVWWHVFMQQVKASPTEGPAATDPS